MQRVLLLGPSSAGKTSITKALKDNFQWQVVSQDDIADEIRTNKSKQQDLRKQHDQLMLEELQKQNLISELKEYMTEKQVVELCATGKLSISTGTHRKNGDTRVVEHQFESPNFNNMPELMLKLKSAGFSQKESHFLSVRLRLVGTTIHQLPDMLLTEALNAVFDKKNDGKPVVYDAVPPGGGSPDYILKLFNQRAEQYRQENPDKPIEVFAVAALSSPQNLSKRVLQRNVNAETKNNLIDLREGIFPFQQLSSLTTTTAQDTKTPTIVGTVSKKELQQIAYKHPGRIITTQSSQAPETKNIQPNEYYLIKNMESGNWQIHYRRHNKVHIVHSNEFPNIKGLEKLIQAFEKFDIALAGRKPEEMSFDEFVKHVGDIRKILLDFDSKEKGAHHFRRAAFAVKESIVLANNFVLPTDAKPDEKVTLMARTEKFDFIMDTTSTNATPQDLAVIFTEQLKAAQLKRKTTSPLSGTARTAILLDISPSAFSANQHSSNKTDTKVKSAVETKQLPTSKNSESPHKKDTVPQAVLDNAKIPALSATWYQNGEIHSLVGGIADPVNSKNVDEFTLFQAASLSKPISAAIILDLVAQGKWDLDKPLAKMGVDFGSNDMKKDPRYEKLTTRMIIAQCSGLPNWFKSSLETFDAEPGTHFTYSGVAYECLKEVVEKTLGKTWGELAQNFFRKVGMEHSTFQLPENTHLKDSTIARGYNSDNTPGPVPSPVGFKEVPAASLLTTAEDYIRFLQYCYSNPSLQNIFASHTHLNPPEHKQSHEKITWGLGMGVFKDAEKEIAFHWGNNPYSRAFCAIDMKTGDAVACFVNSQNGPNVFQILSENIVGNMKPVFEWLSKFDNFNAIVKSDSPEALKVWAKNFGMSPHANTDEKAISNDSYRKI